MASGLGVIKVRAQSWRKMSVVEVVDDLEVERPSVTS